MAYLRNYNTRTDFQSKELPFDIKFDFKKVIAYWEKMASSEQKEIAAHAQQFLKHLRLNAPAILAVSYTHLTLPTNREV